MFQALELVATAGFSFCVDQVHPPQRAGGSVISAMVASINGRPQDMRIFSDRIDRSSIVCLGALGTPFLFLDFTAEVDACCSVSMPVAAC